MERFEQLRKSSECLYTAGSPVVISAMALLKDTQTGNIIAQIKYQSIDNRNIIAVFADFEAKDISGASLDGVTNFQYLDLNIKRNENFGAKTAVNLPDGNTRQISVGVKRVIFSDNTAWEAPDDANWIPVTMHPLVEKLGNAEYVEQYKRDTVPSAAFVPEENLDLRLCACGILNKREEKYCCVCGLDKEKAFTALDKETLQINLETHNEKMRIEAEQQKAEQEANAKIATIKRKKRNKWIAIISAIALVVILAVSIPLGIATSKANERAAVITQNLVGKEFEWINEHTNAIRVSISFTFIDNDQVWKYTRDRETYYDGQKVGSNRSDSDFCDYKVKVSLSGDVTVVISEKSSISSFDSTRYDSTYKINLDNNDNPISIADWSNTYALVKK